MFNLWEELENYRIPWLIWIQLIVFFLLLLLLFCFTLLPLDPDHDAATVTVTAAATTVLATASTSNYDIIQQIDKQPLAKHDSTVTVVTNHRHHSQFKTSRNIYGSLSAELHGFENLVAKGGQNLSVKGEIATSSSMRREEIIEGEASLSFHPCHYFQLVTVAFLKCFGLDSTSDSPPTRRHMKRKES